MDGIVSSIKASVRPADNLYTVVSDRVVQIRSKLMLDLYDKVSFDMAEADVCGDVEIKGSGKDDYEAVMGRLVDRMGIEANLKKIGLDDKRYSGVISKAMPRLVDAAKTFGRCFASGAPMVSQVPQRRRRDKRGHGAVQVGHGAAGEAVRQRE